MLFINDSSLSNNNSMFFKKTCIYRYKNIYQLIIEGLVYHVLITSTRLFEIAKKRKFSIPAMNFVDRTTLKAYVETAERLKAPIIVQFAQAHNDVMELEEAALLGRYYAKKSASPVILHLDHGEDIDFVNKAVDLGFTSVMIDASKEPLEENIRRTKEVMEYAHARSVVVEAEIGHVGSGENYENHETTDSIYTEVEDAILFVKQTNVDSLAISIGTAHGNYLSKPKINFERLEEINRSISTPLVLHGGSSSGDENLVKCSESGIVKINIFTDIVNGAIKNLEKFDGSYMDVTEFLEENIGVCVEHYLKLFKADRFLK